jgi:hypothetical protein
MPVSRLRSSSLKSVDVRTTIKRPARSPSHPELATWRPGSGCTSSAASPEPLVATSVSPITTAPMSAASCSAASRAATAVAAPTSRSALTAVRNSTS